MSNYTKTTDFAAKDSLATGNPSKIVRGSEFETEFDAISTAIATKADTAGPTFTGTATFATTNATTVQIGGVAITSTAAELNLLDGVTATTAELNILDGVTSTATELNLLDGITGILDEDNMASDSATALATQQSIKAYVDTTVAATNELVEDTTPQLGGNLDLNSNNITGTGNIDITGTVVSDGADIDGAAVFNESGADVDFRVESSQKANMLLVDAGNNRVGIGTGVPDTTLHVTTTTSGGVLTLESTSSNSSAGPNILSYRSSSTPAADDNLGKIIYRGTNSAAEDVDYVSVESVLTSPTDGAEQGQYDIETMVDGTSRNRLRINNSETVFNDGGRDLDFRVESDTQSHMLFVDAGNNHVNIASSTDYGGRLNVVTGDNTTTLALVSTDADASVGPKLVLRRDSASPADNDNAGQILFTAENDAGADTTYGFIRATLEDVTDGTEDGILDIQTITAGSTRSRVKVAGTETIINESSQDLDFRVESDTDTHAFFVQGSNGFIGVGTSSPAHELHIDSSSTSSSLRLTNSTGTSGFDLLTSGVTGYLYNRNNGSIRFGTNNTEVVRIDSSGNLLVGKTSSDLNTEGVELQSDRIYATRDGGQALAVNRKTSDGSLISFHKDGTEFGSIKVVNSNNLWVGGSVADHAGLQFGTHVIIPMEASSGSDGTLDLGNSTNRFKDLYLSGDVYATNIKGQNDTNTKIEFVGGDVTRFVQGGTERARFSATGHFLVGKTSTTLSAAGAEIRSTGLIRATTNDATVLQLNRTTGTGTAIDFRYDGTTVGAVVAEASNIRVNFTTDGNQYIKGNNTSDFLSFYTAGAEDMRLTSGGDLHVDGNVIAYSTTISDRRLKSDITNISDALDKVGQINGVTFVRDHNGEKAAGVVAQEIMEVLPEAVKSQALPLQTGEQDQEYYVVEYDAVTGLLVEAVKELKARVEALEAQ